MTGNTEAEAYKLDKDDYDAVNEAAEWFMGTLKPRTASEVRGVLVRLYLTGMKRGVSMARVLVAETIEELS